MGLDFSDSLAKTTTKQNFILALITLLGTLCLISLFTRFIDQSKFKSLGFESGFILKDSLIGISIGLVIMLAGFLLLVQSKQLQIVEVNFSFIDTFWIFGTYVCVGITEELLLRGYVLNNLMISFNRYIALIISSAIFCIMHFANPNLNIIGIIALLLAGLLFGICYIITKNLWLPIALHFSWNFFQALLGFNVSGQGSYSIITTSFNKETIWNGGNFGFEGSVIALLFQPAAIVVIFYLFKNRIPAPDTRLAINSDQPDL